MLDWLPFFFCSSLRRKAATAHYLSLIELADKIKRRECSPVDVVEAHLRHAADLQPKLNAFVTLDAERAMAQARDAESALQKKETTGPLHGVPLTIKSCIDVAGLRCPAGSALRCAYIPLTDAPLVSRLKAAGAVILGNTNTPEFLMAYETNNSLQGRTSNPWDLERTPGGSSGGEAAAIAAGCSAGGVGSDGGGSIRVPAHFSGICGLKPTPGRIPISGHFPPGGGAFPWLGVVGPMARTVADVRLLFEVMAGPDAGDPLAAPVLARRPSEADLRGLRVGILESDALGTATLETRAAVEIAATALADQGFSVEPANLTGLDQALELWWFFFGPMVGHLLNAGLAAADVGATGGLSPGLSPDLSPMLSEYLAVTEREPAPTLDKFLNACAERDICRTSILRQMQNVPVLLSAVSLTPAFRHGEGTWKPGSGGSSYRDTMRHSQWLNLTGFPGAVVPVGKSPEGLPIGVQIIGRPYEDELVLAVAERIQASRGPFLPPDFS